MTKIKDKRVNLFCGIIYGKEHVFRAAKRKLIERCGPADMEAGPFVFDFTDYYRQEMGAPLQRRFISFKNPVKAADAYNFKIFSGIIERDLISPFGNGGRQVNVDPGYIDMSKVILFSTKDYYHRILLGSGIFAEVTMHFSKGDFRFFPWTYPDYRTESYLSFFRELRTLYSKKLSP